MRGELTEAIVLAKLIALGYTVSRPFGDNARYDMILDDGKKLYRVQVKTAWLNGKGRLEFNTASTHPISGKKTLYTDQVEAFIAYSPYTQKMYWVPIQEVTGTRFGFRLTRAANNQTVGVRMAADYQIGRKSS